MNSTPLALILMTGTACAPKGAATSGPAAPASGSEAVVPPALVQQQVDEPPPPPPPGGSAAMAEALALVPDGADILIGIDARRVAHSEFGGMVLDVFDEELRDVVEGASACAVGRDAWRLAVVGSVNTDPNSIALLLSATNLGDEPTFRCLVDQINARAPNAGLTVEVANGRVVAKGSDQTLTAVSTDLVAVVGTGWTEAFEQRLVGAGVPAIDGSLREPIGLVDTSTELFLVARGPGGQGPTAFDSVTGTLSLSNGLGYSVFFYFSDPTAAEQSTQAFRDQFNSIKGMASVFGIPQAAVDRVQIDSQGRAVHVRGFVTLPEFEGVVEQVRKSTP